MSEVTGKKLILGIREINIERKLHLFYSNSFQSEVTKTKDSLIINH